MSVALAHEYFSAHGGAERVVEVFHRMYPDAPVYTFFHDRRAYGPLPGYQLRTSFLQSVPLGGGLHRAGEGEQCSDGALGWHALEHLSPSTARITRQHSQPACGYIGQVQVAHAERSGVIESPQRLH